MRINYVELGAHKGTTIKQFLSIVKGTSDDIHVYGIEGHPDFLKECEDGLKGEKNIHLYNFLVHSYDGVGKLYIGENKPSGEGCSIYDTKNNILLDEYIEVETKRLSTWLEENPLPEGVNIIRANIEGAEWEVVHDMAEHDLFDTFQIYTGNQDYWTWDFQKVGELHDKRATMRTILKAHGVTITPMGNIPSKIREIT